MEEKVAQRSPPSEELLRKSAAKLATEIIEYCCKQLTIEGTSTEETIEMDGLPSTIGSQTAGAENLEQVSICYSARLQRTPAPSE